MYTQPKLEIMSLAVFADSRTGTCSYLPLLAAACHLRLLPWPHSATFFAVWLPHPMSQVDCCPVVQIHAVIKSLLALVESLQPGCLACTSC